MSGSRSEVWNVAVHEAGHGVAVWVYGGDLVRLNAGTYSEGGACQFEDGPAARGYVRAVVSYAGPEAARTFADQAPGGDAIDGDIAAWAVPDINARARARDEARRLVRDYRPAVLAVARLLAARGELTGSEAVEAMTAATFPHRRGHARV
jgi:hypothetical protein